MYLHIGNNDVLLLKDILGIFSIENLKKSSENNRMFKELKFEDDDKTLIIINKNNETKYYYTKVSINTVQKRIKKSKKDLLETK